MEDRPPEATETWLTRVELFIDRRFGPITAARGIRPAAPEPDWWTFALDISRETGRYFQSSSNHAQGTSINEPEARLKALAEAIERYVLANSLERAELELMRAGDNPILVRLPRCAEDEDCLPSFKNFDPDYLLTHCMMKRLSDGRGQMVPAGLVHSSFSPAVNEPPVVVPTSSGAAFHCHLPSAILNGLCEVAERDASMRFWLNRKPVGRVTFEGSTLPFALRERLSRLEQTPLTLEIYDISTEFPFPVILCSLSGATYPYKSFGTACNANLDSAIISAIDEAVAVRFKNLRNVRQPRVVSRKIFDWVQNFDDHSEFFASWHSCPAFDFFANESAQISYNLLLKRSSWRTPQDMDDLIELSRHLESGGLTVLWSDITTDDARSLGFCVRVVIPEMIPLSVDHSVRWLASRRLSSPDGKELPSARLFNQYPHPFG